MKSFEYENIKLNKIKLYLKNVFKLMFRRPIYSFLPFLLLMGLVLFLLKINTDVGLISMLLIGSAIMPLISIEFFYSNDLSKIPFKTIKYSEFTAVKEFFLEIIFPVIIFIFTFAIILVIVRLLEYLFPIESVQKVLNETSKNEVVSIPIPFTIIIVSLISMILSLISTCGYFIVFGFKLISLPTLLNSIPQDNLIKEFDKAIHINFNNFIIIFGSLSIFQSFMYVISYKYLGSLFSSITWIILSSFGISLCYIIAKDMSGSGIGLTEKKSLLNKMFNNNKNFAMEQ